MRRGARFHNNTVAGKLVSDVADFPTAFNGLFDAVMNSAGPFIFTMIFGLAIIFAESWQLGLYLLVVVGITLIWAFRESMKRSNLRSVRLAAGKKLIAHTSDNIVNSVAVKTFSAEEREAIENRSLARTLRDLRIKDWTRSGISGANRMAFLLFSVVGLTVVAYFFVDTKTADGLAVGIFALTYTIMLLMRLFEITNIVRRVEESFLQAAPMTEILLQETEVIDVKGAKKLVVENGAVDFRDISFGYTDDATGKKIFSKLNLSIKPGERVGLVGPSGGGKSTLTKLLLRFEDIQAGSITIDGQDVREVTQSSLRNAISYVPQEPLLFHRSIRENITYGLPKASTAKVKRAADDASATEFVEELPNKYETIVGERGVKLSGGQRQRIAIARAMLKNAPILVLDEATSALDSESEAKIQDAIFSLMKGKTALVVAHRLSTIQNLDRIVVINKGTVLEEGSHSDLLKQKGLYANLWKRQSGGFLKED